MKEVRLGKAAQTGLLLFWTVAILVVTVLVQGGEGVRTNLSPFEDVVRLAARAGRGGVLSNAVLWALAGIVGNLTVFGVWGFLLWKFVDGPGRRPFRNDVDVILAGILFSSGIETVQLFLPTRAADVNDVFWNALGALAGAAVAHSGKNVRLVWE